MAKKMKTEPAPAPAKNIRLCSKTTDQSTSAFLKASPA